MKQLLFVMVALAKPVMGVAGATFFVSSYAKAEAYMTEQEALHKVVPGALKFEKTTGILTDEQKNKVKILLNASEADRMFAYYLGRGKDGGIAGYAVITDEIGKYQPITFAVGIARDLTISMIEIIAFRESHGGEITRTSFREQFNGKTIASGLSLDAGIRNIAGATLSCRSVVKGARRSLAYVTALRDGQDSPGSGVGKSRDVQPRQLNQPNQQNGTKEKTNKGAHLRNQVIMGTSMDIQAWPKQSALNQVLADQELSTALDDAFALVRRIEKGISLYDPVSELSRWEIAPNRAHLKLSRDVVEIAKISSEMRTLTDGYFDPASKHLVDFWRRQVSLNKYPTNEEISVQVSVIQKSNWTVDSERSIIESNTPLTFDAIAKGYALDQVRALISPFASRYLINFGGQILAVDAAKAENGKKSGFDVVLDHPAFAHRRIKLLNESISVSSDSEQGSSIAGQSVSHILNPHTGMPKQELDYVAVIASSAARADALSTALVAMDRNQALKFAGQQNDVKIVIADKAGTVLRDFTN